MTAYDMGFMDWSSDVCSSDLAVRSAICWVCRARSWLPACAACNAPVADWLAPTMFDMAVRAPSILPTTPAWTFNASSNPATLVRSEEHTSELQSLMRISYAVFCLKKKNKTKSNNYNINNNTDDQKAIPHH